MDLFILLHYMFQHVKRQQFISRNTLNENKQKFLHTHKVPLDQTAYKNELRY